MQSEILYDNRKSQCPDISFIIPTYKRAKYLKQAVYSVARLKGNLTYEILVVNNDPNDDMSYIIDDFKNCNIIFLRNVENYGQVGNLNQGILFARGKFVSILHDDDLLMDNYLVVIELFLKQNEFSCFIPSQYNLYTKYRFDFKNLLVNFIFFYRFLYRKRIKEIRPFDCLYSFRDVYNPPTCGTIFKRDDLIKFHLFENVKGNARDYYNFRKFNKEFRVCLIHSFLGIRRLYSGISNEEATIKEFIEDEIDLVNENQNNFYIKTFGKNLIKKSGVKFYIAKIIKNFYFYSHNLDSIKNLKRKYFKIYKRKYETMQY